MSATMFDDDQQLEVEIDAAYARLLSVATLAEKQEAFGRMRDLIARRSATQIARMERERGLEH